MKYYTKNYIIVSNFLMANSDKHLTIEQIYSMLEEKVPLASIYRIIDRLVEEGKVRKYIIDKNNSACFQYIDENDPHSHFHLICTKCGKLIHLECSEVNHLLHHIEDEHGFYIDLGKVNLYGLCESCKKEEKN